MRKLFNFSSVILLVLALVFVGCGNDDDENPTNPGGGGSSTLTLSGTIQSWSQGGDLTLKAQFEDRNGSFSDIASSNISSNGSFSITLPTPNESSISLLDLDFNNLVDSSDENCGGGLNASDMNAKGGTLQLNVYNGTTYVGELIKVKADLLTGLYSGMTIWTYVDRDVNFTGNIECTDVTDSLNYVSNFTANANLKKGWNTSSITSQLAVPDSTTIEVNFTIGNGEASGTIWYFDDGSFLKPVAKK